MRSRIAPDNDDTPTADIDGPVQGSPAIADGAVFVSDAGGSFTSLDLASGMKHWSVPVKPMRHPVVVGGTIYVGTEDGQFLGLDPVGGSQRWSWQAPAGVAQVTGTVVDDTAYIGADDGNLYAVPIAAGGSSAMVTSLLLLSDLVTEADVRVLGAGPVAVEPRSMLVPADLVGGDTFVDALDVALEEMRADGTLAELLSKRRFDGEDLAVVAP